MNKYIIDSSAWFEYFEGTEKGIKLKKIIEEETIATAIIAIAKLSAIFERDSKSFEKSLQFIESRAAILNLSIEAAVNSGKLKNKIRKNNPKFGLADAMHLALAIEEEAILITCDHDFERIKGAIVI